MDRLLARSPAGLPGPITRPILPLPRISLVQQRAPRLLAVHLGALKCRLLQVLPKPPPPHCRVVHVRVVRRAQRKPLHVEGAHVGPGLGLEPAPSALLSASARRPPTRAGAASLRLSRRRGRTCGTRPESPTPPTRPRGNVDLKNLPEDVGGHLSERRVYPHAASWQGRNRGRPPPPPAPLRTARRGRSTARRRHFDTHAAGRARRPACAHQQAGRPRSSGPPNDGRRARTP